MLSAFLPIISVIQLAPGEHSCSEKKLVVFVEKSLLFVQL